MATEGQSDRMASDMKVCMKQSCVPEFLHVEKMANTGIHWCLLNIYGDQVVDVSTVRRWVVCFSSGNRNSQSPPVVQILTHTACGLFFIAGKKRITNEGGCVEK